MLTTVSLVTMVLAILATRPNLAAGRFSIEDLEKQKVNLLFFGNFYKMSLDEYASGMKTIMEHKDLLYGTLIMDVHTQGIVLGRKYQLLRLCYSIFMFGLVGSTTAFLIATILNAFHFKF